MTEIKKLTRPTEGRMLGGVCAGIARYMKVDRTIVRIATVVLALVTAVVPFIVGYVVAWLLMPEDDSASTWGRVTDPS